MCTSNTFRMGNSTDRYTSLAFSLLAGFGEIFFFFRKSVFFFCLWNQKRKKWTFFFSWNQMDAISVGANGIQATNSEENKSLTWSTVSTINYNQDTNVSKFQVTNRIFDKLAHNSAFSNRWSHNKYSLAYVAMWPLCSTEHQHQQQQQQQQKHTPNLVIWIWLL